MRQLSSLLQYGKKTRKMSKKIKKIAAEFVTREKEEMFSGCLSLSQMQSLRVAK